MRKVEDLTTKEKDIIEQQIDDEFTRQFLQPRRVKVEYFLKEVILNQRGIELIEECEIEIFNLFFYANCPLSSFSIEPNSLFIPEEFVLKSPEIELPYFAFCDVSEMVEDILKMNQIDYSYMFDDEDFDPAHIWENKSELEFEFYKSCWDSLDTESLGNKKCFLCANDGSFFADITDRSSNRLLRDKTIPEYLKSLGITPQYHGQKKKWWKRK